MPRLSLTVLLALALFSATAARAQTLEDRLRSQLVTVTTQLRDAQSSQAALTAEKDAAEKARDGLKAQLAAAQAKAAKQVSRPAAPPPELAQYKAQVEQLSQAQAQQQSQLDAARTDASRLQAQIDRLRAEHDRSVTAQTSVEASLAACKAKNVQALKVAKDILNAYGRVTVADVLARKEPLIGLARVRVEQLEQDYGDRIYNAGVGVAPKRSAPSAGRATSTTTPPK